MPTSEKVSLDHYQKRQAGRIANLAHHLSQSYDEKPSLDILDCLGKQLCHGNDHVIEVAKSRYAPLAVKAIIEENCQHIIQDIMLPYTGEEWDCPSPHEVYSAMDASYLFAIPIVLTSDAVQTHHELATEDIRALSQLIGEMIHSEHQVHVFLDSGIYSFDDLNISYSQVLASHIAMIPEYAHETRFSSSLRPRSLAGETSRFPRLRFLMGRAVGGLDADFPNDVKIARRNSRITGYFDTESFILPDVMPWRIEAKQRLTKYFTSEIAHLGDPELFYSGIENGVDLHSFQAAHADFSAALEKHALAPENSALIMIINEGNHIEVFLCDKENKNVIQSKVWTTKDCYERAVQRARRSVHLLAMKLNIPHISSEAPESVATTEVDITDEVLP